MEDDSKPAIPPLVPALSKSVQRRQRAQAGSDPIKHLEDVVVIKQEAGPVTRIYRVIETCSIPLGAARVTLQAGEELSSRQHDIPRLVALGARLQEIV